ncbi:sugar O-acyltransferase, sialic acid O-acetyltransferase NeuD family [Butyrivibrio fibrisolvens 16/4]|nr:sugar O-acyltransferase, sialic acid O-acetyltransferase NeuD family [Butyrivibrio fibrisolvens 16/4]
MKDLYIIGAGGFGKEVAWLAERINDVQATWEIKGFIDDNDAIWGTTIDDYPVLGGTDYLKSCDGAYVVCAVGSAKVRKKIIEKISNYPIQFATLIDPSVIMSKRVTVGEGTIICAGTIITVDVTIGNHVIINLDCTLGHDDVIHDYVTMYPSVNVSGCCEVGSCVEFGTGMQILQGLSVVDGAIVGASACVVKNIEEARVYVGAPAKRIK